MTKHIRHALILAALLFTLLPSSAVRYRGFVEASGGKAFYGDNRFLTESFKDTWTANFLTTHGFQCNNLLFVGIGTGLQLQQYTEPDDLFLLYSNIHLDFKSHKETHPYLDFKLGSYWGATVMGDYYSSDYANYGYLYISIGFGYRIKMTDFSGFNIGLSLNSGPHYSQIVYEGKTYGCRLRAGDINLNLGIDF